MALARVTHNLILWNPVTFREILRNVPFLIHRGCKSCPHSLSGTWIVTVSRCKSYHLLILKFQFRFVIAENLVKRANSLLPDFHFWGNCISCWDSTTRLLLEQTMLEVIVGRSQLDPPAGSVPSARLALTFCKERMEAYKCWIRTDNQRKY